MHIKLTGKLTTNARVRRAKTQNLIIPKNKIWWVSMQDFLLLLVKDFLLVHRRIEYIKSRSVNFRESILAESLKNVWKSATNFSFCECRKDINRKSARIFWAGASLVYFLNFGNNYEINIVIHLTFQLRKLNFQCQKLRKFIDAQPSPSPPSSRSQIPLKYHYSVPQRVGSKHCFCSAKKFPTFYVFSSRSRPHTERCYSK